MKITRRLLLTITASLGALIIVYSIIRHFTGLGLGEKGEKFLMDGVIIAALGLFFYNRKLASDEKKAREAAKDAELRAPEDETADNGDLPHWERGKNNPAGETGWIQDEQR